MLRVLAVALVCPLLVSASTSAEGSGAASRPARARAAAGADTSVTAAGEALSRGLAWRASRILAPVLRDSARRTPAAVVLAARAAGEWGGWGEVRRLLDAEPWVDTLFGGDGRALLARAALERGDAAAAARHASAAVGTATTPRDRGERLVVLARALDRLDSLAAAAAAYDGAAGVLPDVGDWLRFRAGIVTPDSAARAARFAELRSPVVRDRVAAAEAEARERAGDPAAAARAYAALGSAGTAFRLRLAAAGNDDSVRAILRRDLVDYITAHTGSANARGAVAVLDAGFAPLPATTELLVARALASGGSRTRAVAAYRAAFKAGLGTPRDRFDYATQLFELDRYAEAAAQFARVRSPAPLAASAAYQRARALVRGGQLAAGRTALRAIGRTHAKQADAAASALYLLADLATDEQRDADARAAFRELARRYPGARLAASARFRAATIAYAAGDYRAAARELDSLAVSTNAGAEALAARYWSGRAWRAAGDTVAANTRWREAARRDSAGYYGAAASRRLGVTPWTPAPALDSFVSYPDIDSALARATMLRRLGLEREARWEEDRVARDADTSVDRLLGTAAAFRSHGLASRAVQLGWRALGRGARPDARTYRLIYPLVQQEALLAEADERGLDPVFVAALIRQESMFNPAATSGAGARGLMQVMPDVGRSVAASLGFPVWDAVLLYQPDVNIQLGAAHLQELTRRYPQPVRVLAAYNAGAPRVERWSRKVGTTDPELFAERIPYRETRDYVRIIQRNTDLYASLYVWTGRGHGGV